MCQHDVPAKTGRAGGAILTSGTATVKNCLFSGNRATLGPAVSNTATVTLENTAFRDNALFCDDVDGSMFLDWQSVSSEKRMESKASAVGL